MRAICYTEDRSLEVREVPKPREPAPSHVLVNMDFGKHHAWGQVLS